MIDVRRAAAVAAAAGWLAAVGVLVWLHARASIQPPAYDAFTYYLKARNVWAALDAGVVGWSALQAIVPTFRPFGTVLMSYPFGFDADVHGFYFRSVFVPIALVFAAASIAGGAGRRSAWPTVLAAAFLATLPLFFQFDLYVGSAIGLPQWGFVDGFMTGIATLGSACAVRCVVARRSAWGIAAALVAAFGIFVKPTGAPLAMLVAGIAIVGGSATWWRMPSTERPAAARALALVTGAMVVAIGGAILVALHSAYLDAGNLMYGQAAIDVMRAELRPDFQALLLIAYDGLGPFVPPGIVAALVVWSASPRKASRDAATGDEPLLVAMAGVIVVIGLWFWLVGSGGQTQVRYFPPFLYAGAMCALPPMLRALVSARPAVRVAAVVWTGIAIANTTLLLAVPRPSDAWQRASGVNVRSGIEVASIGQARALVAERSLHSPLSVASTVAVYAIDLDVNDAMFDAVFSAHGLVATKPLFVVRRPIDWQRPSTFRLDEIAAADYLLFDPFLVSSARDDGLSFADERATFRRWAASLTMADGVERAADAPRSRLVRVVDHARLRSSLDRLVATHRWRAVFVDENPPRWWSRQDVSDALARAPVRVGPIRFDDRFVMAGASLEPGVDANATLKVWLEARVFDDDWAILVHLVDANGKPLVDRDIALGALEPGPATAPYRLFRTRFALPREVRTVAIGLYRGKGETILKADDGPRDWNGMRVLLTIPGNDRR